jgi:predicted nucleic acid-binding Zn finger protein
VAANSYFHRVLPFDLALVDDLNPRLAAARELLEQQAVKIIRNDPVEAQVGDHRVREVAHEMQCTCPWFAKYQGARGPCKHVLAVEATR